MKNFKKFIATILATTLTFGCVGCMSTLGSADFPKSGKDSSNIFDLISSTESSMAKKVLLAGFIMEQQQPLAVTDFTIRLH